MRFVVLHHTGFGAPHFDLMLEPRDPGARLVTFRASSWPITTGNVLEQIGDHRRDYLAYEGPLGQGRGEVVRVEEGTYERTAADVSESNIGLQLTTRSGMAEITLRKLSAPRNAWMAQIAVLREVKK